MVSAGHNDGTANAGMRRLTPLVGRGELLAAAEAQITAWLRQTYKQDSSDQSSGSDQSLARNRLLVLTGPPAVGKSRLAYELMQRLAGKHGVSSATAHCIETASLSGFAAEVTQVAGLNSKNLPDRWEELCHYAGSAVNKSYAERARRYLPLLALLLDCAEVDTSGIRQADTGSFIPGVKLALRACCELTARFTGKPVALVIEDLQWMGALREVISDLLTHASLPQPLVVIGTARPEFAATAEQLAALVGAEANGSPSNGEEKAESTWRVLELPPLSRLEGERLVREVVPRLKLPAELEEELARKAAGLPYYYEEFARLLLSRQLVIEGEDELSAAVDLSGIELPEGLAELIQNRLADLEPGLRDLTGRAAVIGRSFTGERLRKLEEGLGLVNTKQTAKGLAQLEQHQLLASEAGDRYFFEHALTRDAAYSALPAKHRLEMHKAMAATLEEMLVPGTASEWDILPEQIKHLEGSRCYQAAHERTCDLLELMARMGRHSGYEGWFSKALSNWQQIPAGHTNVLPEAVTGLQQFPTPADYPRSPWLHMAACELDRHQGYLESALAHAAIALEISTQADDKSGRMRSLRSMGSVHDAAGRLEQARICLEEALSLAREIGDVTAETWLMHNLGGVYLRLGRYKNSRDCLEKSLELAQQTRNLRAEARILNNLAVLHESLSEWPQAQNSFEKALAIARELGDLMCEVLVLRGLSTRLSESGKRDEALSALYEALAVARQINEKSAEADILNKLGSRLFEAGKQSDVASYYEASLAICREIGDSQLQGWNLFCLADCHHIAGELDRALECIDQSLKLARQVGDPQYIQIALSGLGVIQAKRGKIEEAFKALTEADRLTAEMRNDSLLSYAQCYWSYYHLAIARQDSSDEQQLADALGRAHQCVSQAEVLCREAGLSEGSALFIEIELARKILKEFEREQSEKSVAD